MNKKLKIEVDVRTHTTSELYFIPTPRKIKKILKISLM
tara:strand:- start:566 stop:679 length:114 start_codon:yes stop_codon:yes gene_type:complete